MSQTVDLMLDQTPGWLRADGPRGDMILSTRIRLARNLRGIKFVSQASDKELLGVLNRVRMAVDGIPESKDAKVALMEDLNLMERQFLFERHLISHDMTVGAPHRAVCIGDDEMDSVMINEEDHLRIQTLGSGCRLPEAHERVNRLDDSLSERLEYSFDGDLGYLTSCPTNVGTGLRASVLIHLPSLVLTKKIRKVLAGVTHVGLSVRGFWGEGSDVVGNLFQISNQVTLGEREAQTLRNLDRVITQVLGYEEKARDVLIRDARAEIEDKIGRSFGTLCQARILSSQEMVGLLSAVRFGVTLEMPDLPDLAVINKLLIFGQPAHIQLLAGREMNSAQRNRFRATMVREHMGSAAEAVPGGDDGHSNSDRGTHGHA
jgi:protein arginine kinase